MRSGVQRKQLRLCCESTRMASQYKALVFGALQVQTVDDNKMKRIKPESEYQCLQWSPGAIRWIEIRCIRMWHEQTMKEKRYHSMDDMRLPLYYMFPLDIVFRRKSGGTLAINSRCTFHTTPFPHSSTTYTHQPATVRLGKPASAIASQ